MQQTHIMGILNVTPDSFSDGSSCNSQPALMARIDTLLAEGADYIDVGGESTRPFAKPVSVEEELQRVLPAIRAIRARSSSLPISIDTTKARVAAEALAAGASMVNDISALRHDQDMVRVVAGYVGPVIIMHMQGNPATMQVQPSYQDVVVEINDFFTERISYLVEQGIERNRIIIDPGIGFGKTLEHNLTILRNIPDFRQHGCPVLIGHSRKSFLDQLLGLPVEKRDWPSAVVSAFCARNGVDILRVHDVHATRLALTLERVLREEH